MKKWREYPYLLIRRFLFLLLTGIVCAGIGIIIFIAAGDRILLGLSIAIGLGSLWRGILLWRLIQGGSYEIVAGICVGISALPFRRFKKLKIMDECGIESGLLIHKQARIRIGYCYCFFFKKEGKGMFQSEYLATMLTTDLFLGYEELGEYMEEKHSIETERS